MIYYTYLHCKPDGTPFYVGKGSGRRSHDFVRNQNLHHKRTVEKLGKHNVKVFVFPCDSEALAFEYEVLWIAQLRQDRISLVNLTSGGDGPSGLVHSEEAKKKMSGAHKGKKFSDDHRKKISNTLAGRKRPEFSEEWRAKISAAQRGRVPTDETRAKLSKASIGNKGALGLKRGIRSAEHRLKLSIAMTGKTPWNKGLKK